MRVARDPLAIFGGAWGASSGRAPVLSSRAEGSSMAVNGALRHFTVVSRGMNYYQAARLLSMALPGANLHVVSVELPRGRPETERTIYFIGVIHQSEQLPEQRLHAMGFVQAVYALPPGVNPPPLIPVQPAPF